jgi:hypothetical protein
MRLCETFMNERGHLLADHGYTPDPGRLELTEQTITFYHYTREEHLAKILAVHGGLWARLPVVSPPPGLVGLYLVEGLLEPLPRWLTDSAYFGNLGLELIKEFVGDVLLRVRVPRDFPGLSVADYAHVMEAKHVLRRERPALDLGYDCTTGSETSRADAYSYVPALAYMGGHVAPELKATRIGPGIAVPSEYISVAQEQPLK